MGFWFLGLWRVLNRKKRRGEEEPRECNRTGKLPLNDDNNKNKKKLTKTSDGDDLWALNRKCTVCLFWLFYLILG